MLTAVWLTIQVFSDPTSCSFTRGSRRLAYPPPLYTPKQLDDAFTTNLRNVALDKTSRMTSHCATLVCGIKVSVGNTASIFRTDMCERFNVQDTLLRNLWQSRAKSRVRKPYYLLTGTSIAQSIQWLEHWFVFRSRERQDSSIIKNCPDSEGRGGGGYVGARAKSAGVRSWTLDYI